MNHSFSFFLLFNMLIMSYNLSTSTINSDRKMACDADFVFSTTSCNQTVTFQATAPTPVSNPNYTFSWDFGDGTPNGSGANVQHTYNAPGGGTRNYAVELTVTEAGTGCTSTIQHSVTIDEKPHALISDTDLFSPFAFCDGDSSTLVIQNQSNTASENASYHINWGDGSPPFTTANFTTTSHPYNGLGGYLITVTVTGINGCISTFSTEFYMGGNPAIGISIPSLGNICNSTMVPVNLENWQSNSPGTIYVITSNSSPNSLFTFPHPPPAVVNVSFGLSSCGFVSRGGYQDAFHITVEAINPCGTASATVEPVRVSSPPTAAIQETLPANACPGQQFRFCDASFGAGYYVTSLGGCTEAVVRQWTISPGSYSLGGSTLTDSCLTVVFNAPGTYTVCLDVSNPCGASSACETVVIAETPFANANAIYSGDGCAPMSVTFQNLSQNNAGNIWTITPPTGWSGNLNTPGPNVTFTAPGSYNVALTVSNPCGNDTWDTVIVVKARPTVTLPAVPIICEGGQITPTATVSNNGCVSDCVWSFPGGTPSSFMGCMPPPITYNTTGNYTYSVTTTNCCGSTTASQMVIVSGIPNADANAVLSNIDGCAPLTVTLQNLSQNNPNNNWMVTPLTGWNGNLNVPNPTINITSPGSYDIKLTILAGICGMDTWDTTIVVRALPTVTLSAIAGICEGDQIIPSANFTANGCPITTYDWSFSGGTPSSFTGQIPPPVVYNQAGNYTVSVSATNCCGSTTMSQPVVVNGVPGAHVNMVPTDGQFCAPFSIMFQNQSQNNPTNLWTITPNTGWTYAAGSNSNSVSPTVNFDAPNTYNIHLAISTAACGSDVWDTTIVVRTRPTVNIIADNIICAGDAITASATISENGCAVTDYDWSFPGGIPSSFSGPVPPTVVYGTAGNHIVSLTTINCCGSTTTSHSLTVEGFVNVTIPEVLELCVGDPCELLSGSPTGCTWSQNGTPVPSNQFCPTTAGTFELVYTCGSVDCSSGDTMMIIVHSLPPINTMPQPLTLCENAPTVQLIATPDDANTWWTGSGVDSAGWFNPALPGAGGTMTYHHLDPVTGCENTRTVQVLVNPVGELNLSDSTFCNAAQIILEEEYGIVEGGGESCTWSGVGISNVTNGTFILPPNTTLPAVFTIFYTCENAMNCSLTDSIKIIINELQSADAGVDTTLCAAGIHQLMGNFGPEKWTGPILGSGPPVTMDGMINLELSPVGVHTYNYTYTAFEGTSCETSDQMAVTIINLADVNAGMDQHYCVTDGIVTLSIPTVPVGNTIILSGEGVVDPFLGQVDVSLIPVGTCATLTYTVVSNTLNGCAASDSFQFCVYDLPLVDFSIIGQTCVETSLVFGNLTTGASNYCWDFGDNSPIVCQNVPPSHAYTDGGDYIVTLTAWTVNPLNMSDTLCLAFKKDTIRITEPPELVAFTATPADSCADLTLSFVNESLGEGLAFEWYKDGILFSTDFTPAPIVLTQGQSDTTYTISLAVANGCGGSETSKVILVRPRPRSVIGTNLSTYCSGETILLANNSYGNVEEYQWYRHGELISTDSIPPVVQRLTDSLETLEICLVSTNECGADTSCVYPVVHPANVNAFFYTDTTQACVGQPVCFTNLSSSWANVQYNFGDGSGSVDGNSCHEYAAPGEYLVVLRAVGCGYDSFTVMIKVHPLPISAFSYTGTPCPRKTFQFTNNSENGVAYLWKFGDGTTSTQYAPTHDFDEPGDYPVCLIVTSAFSCQDSICQIVRVEEDPVAEMLPVDSLCLGDTAVFASQSQAGITSCVWTFSDGFFADGCTVSHAFMESGAFIVTLEVENAFGCRDTTSRLVQVRPTPEANFTYEILEPCAPGGKVRFASTSIGATGLRWYIDGQFVQQAAAFEHTFSDPGEHLILLIASNGGICEHEVVQIIQLQESPKLVFDLRYPCESKVTNLFINVLVPGTYGAEVFNDTYFLEGVQHDGLQDGVYQVSVMADNGCQTDTTLTLVAPPQLSILLTPDSSRIILGESVQLRVETNLGNETIVWSPSGWLGDPISFDPVAMPLRTITYVATVTSNRDCIATDTAFIEVIFEIDSSLYVPNIFTPNADGRNDVFRLRSRYPAVSQVKLFQVFARGGQLVFEARDFDPRFTPIEAEWDGTFKGEKLPPDSFTWLAEVVFFGGDLHIFKGEVILAR